MLAMNTYAILSIMFIISSKVAINQNKVDAVDMILIVNSVTMVCTFLLIMNSSTLSFRIPRGNRVMFFARAFEGWLLIVAYIIGNTLVPVTVQQALTNTTPFWAALIASCCTNEKITRFEALAMLISFGGVSLITFSQTT